MTSSARRRGVGVGPALLGAAAWLAFGHAAAAQAPRPAAPPQMETEGDLQLLFVQATVGGLSSVTPEAAAQGQALRARAAAERQVGRLGEMRRRLAQAVAVQLGQPWGAWMELQAALALRPAAKVVDPDGGPLIVEVGQRFHPETGVAVPRRLTATLRPKAEGGQARSFGPYGLLSRDLVDTPFRFSVGVQGLPDGAYWLEVEASDGAAKATARTQLFLVRGLAARQREVERRLAAGNVRSATKAKILYPFDLARTMNEGRRQPLAYDFAAGIAQSEQLVAQLEAGRDPTWQARGLQEKAYWLDAAGRYEAYTLFVPANLDARRPAPLLVLLHGSNGDRNSYLGRNAEWGQLAERHGFILAAPDGYSSNSVWGNHEPVVLADGSSPPARPSTIDAVVLPTDDREVEPAEQTVLEVIEAVAQEHAIDRQRIYLAGNSMGGEGVWHLMTKYPHVFAAGAAGAGPPSVESLARTGIPKAPVLAVHGDRDPITSHDASAAFVAAINRRGGAAQMLSVPGGGHNAFSDVLPRIFAFLGQQRKR